MSTQVVQFKKGRDVAPWRRADRRWGYILASPWLIGFLVFTLGPMVMSLYFSFTNYDILNSPHFVGFSNYTRMVHDPMVSQSLGNTLYMVVLGVPIGLAVSFVLALALNRGGRGLSLFRTFAFLPSVTPVAASSVLWIWLLQADYGVLNQALSFVGIHGPDWLSDPAWSKPSIIMMNTWGSAGTTMLIFLAGLKNIPQELYEAAAIDAAGRWRQFVSITLPLLSPTTFFLVTLGIIGAFQIFAQSYIMTGGGPINSTLFYVYYLFNEAFGSFQMGYASAMAWIQFIIVFIVTLLQFRLSRHWVYYN